MAEEFILRIVDDASASVKSTMGGTSSASTSGGSNKGGSALGGIAKLTGIIGIATAMLSLVGEAVSGILKPVKAAVLGVLKLVAQVLRPVADVIILLLQPLLMFLKPIIKVFNEVMRPFKTLAFGLMKQGMAMGGTGGAGLMALSIATMFAGIGNALLAVLGEVWKFVIDMVAQMVKGGVSFLLDLFRPILEFFGMNVDKAIVDVNNWVDGASADIKGFIDAGILEIQAQSLKLITNLAKNIITGTGGEGMGLNEAQLMLEGTLTKMIDSSTTKIKDKIETGINKMISDMKFKAQAEQKAQIQSGITPWGIGASAGLMLDNIQRIKANGGGVN